MLPSKCVDFLYSGCHGKHGNYQMLHPILQEKLKINHRFSKFEAERFQLMDQFGFFRGAIVTDIGANIGFFSLSCIESGAKKVIAYEGFEYHAKFLKCIADELGLNDVLEVKNEYFLFDNKNIQDHPVDITLCLNVLHHIGSDFNECNSSEEALQMIQKSLQNLSFYTRRLWLQLGYNWKGNKNLPLFKEGTKSEMIEFVYRATEKYWSIDYIGIYDPRSGKFEPEPIQNLTRFNEIGEFLNRPIFLLKSLK